MTIDQFVSKYNGKHVDEDGYYGAQCWDVVARYAREVVGCPIFPTGSGGAEGLYRIFAQPIPQYFDRIANNVNDKNQVPVKGDIVVYTGKIAPPWGHTALVLSANSSKITVLEQNGLNPGGNAYITDRGYNNIYGWLRPKQGAEPMLNQGDVVNLYRAELGRDPDPSGFAQYAGKSWRDAWYGITGSQEYKDRQAARQRQIDALINNVNKLTQDIIALQAAIEDLKKRPSAEEYQALQDQANKANETAKKAQADLEKALGENAEADKIGNSFLRWLGRLLGRDV